MIIKPNMKENNLIRLFSTVFNAYLSRRDAING